MKYLKILIIAAMGDIELNYLLEKMQQKKEEKTKICSFYIGKISNKEVIICNSKIGLINASAATILAIERFHPDIIINEGCAGSCSTNIHKNDLIIGTQCINITSIRTKNRKIGQGSKVEDWEFINFIAGETDRLVPQKATKELLQFIKTIDHKYQYGKVFYGTIGSGDIWNNECDRILELNKKYNILCEEMEGIAIYTIANQYNIPVVGIRVISDNSLLKEEYERNISIRAQEFVEILLEKMDNLKK